MFKYIFFLAGCFLIQFLSGCGVEEEENVSITEEHISIEEEVLSNCIDAIGGREVLENLSVIHTIDSISQAGLTGTIESWWIRDPFLGFTITEIGPLRQEMHIDGDSVWTVDGSGNLTIGGAEERDQADLSRQTVFYEYLLDTTLVSIGKDTILEDSVRAVQLLLNGNPNFSFYYSRESWLPVLMTAVTMGTDVRSFPSAFRFIDGIATAEFNSTVIPDFRQEIATKNILTEYNVTVPETLFTISSGSGESPADLISTSDVWYASELRELFPSGIEIEHWEYSLDELPCLPEDIITFNIDETGVVNQGGARGFGLSGTLEVGAIESPFHVIDGTYMLKLQAYLVSPNGQVVWTQNGYLRGEAWVSDQGHTGEFVLISAYSGSPSGHKLIVVALGDPVYSDYEESVAVLGAKIMQL